MPFPTLVKMAEILAKTNAERTRLISLGMVAHAPRELREYLLWLEERAGGAEALADYRFPGAGR